MSQHLTRVALCCSLDVQCSTTVTLQLQYSWLMGRMLAEAGAHAEALHWLHRAGHVRFF